MKIPHFLVGLLVGSLLTGATIVSAAGGPKVGPEIARFYAHHQTRCGRVVSRETWHLGQFSQAFAHCLIQGHVAVARSATPPPTTRTPVPTVVPAPSPTATIVPTARPTASSPPTSAAEGSPTPVPTPTPAQDLPHIILGWINSERTAAGQSPLAFASTLALGSGACVGAQGHADAMAATGSIWHVNPAYPAASFPTDVCGAFQTAGQNVGVGAGQSDEADAWSDHEQMMAEPHDVATCASQDNHACNILNPAFTRVGIAVAHGSFQGLPALYLVETFAGP